MRAELGTRALACLSPDEVALEAMGEPARRVCRTLAREVSERLVQCGCPKAGGPLAAMLIGGLESKLPGVAAPASIDRAAPAREGATWAEIVGRLGEADLSKLWVNAD